MSCAIDCVRWLMFIFNLIFSLCGLALLICGVLVQINLKNLSPEVQSHVSIPSIGVIIIGCIIFVIAFFGCCGAIRENHCMVVTYAVLLLSILILQIILAVCVFLMLNKVDDNKIKHEYESIFAKYSNSDVDKSIVNTVQTTLSCCGAKGPSDYGNTPYPWTCCEPKDNDKETCKANEVYQKGCGDALVNSLRSGGKLIGGIVLGIAGVELVGIIFSLCLANSIRNADRRAFRV